LDLHWAESLGDAVKRILLAGATVLALAATQPAVAQPMPIFNWSGFYIGINGGYSWGQTRHFFDFIPRDAGTWNVSGGLLGGTIGVNWQAPGSAVVWGIEGDLAWSGIKGDFKGVGCNSGNCYTDIRWLSTVRGRLGWAANTLLWYLTGGLAIAQVDAGVFNSPDVATKTRTGWTIGTGLEMTFAPNWSVKAEYLYVDFGDVVNYTVGTGLTFVKLHTHIARVGLNWRF
jgi:outer membrane immunogenic protein